MESVWVSALRLQGKYALILVLFFWQTVGVSSVWAGPLQDLITAAAPGGTVTIGADTFNETLTIDKNLTLKGESSSATILQPGAAGQGVIRVNAGCNLTLQDLKVTGGQAPPNEVGGGVWLKGGSLTLLNVHITNNTATYGGGVFQEGEGGSVVATDSLIEGNLAGSHGGGMYIRGSAALTNTQVISNMVGYHGGGLHVDAGSATIVGGIFSGNIAGNNGGGINVNNQLTVTGTQFQENTAGDSGGALTQWNKVPGYTISISGATFQNNSCKSRGGAAFINGSLNLANSTLTGNIADSEGAGNVYGGGVYTASPATVTGSTFTGNQVNCEGCSISSGGGLSIELGVSDLSGSTVTDSTFSGNDGWFGGGFSASYGTLNISRCVFESNSGGYGGGLSAYVMNGDHLLFQNNTASNKGGGVSVYEASITNSKFVTNSAGGGGGISAANGALSVTNALFAENSASFLGGGALLIQNIPTAIFNATIAQPSRGSGSGIKVFTDASLVLKNSILTSYTTGIEVGGESVTEDYNLFFDNASTFSGGAVIQGGHSLDGLDPLLANPAGGDYHLTPPSPCINKATSSGAPSTDLDGVKRPQGPGYDMGAFEYPKKTDLPFLFLLLGD